MGLNSISFQEINAYMQSTGTPLNKDEVILIKKLSHAYLSGLNDTDPQSKSPYTPPEK